MSSIDFGRAAHDYARHRAGFPPELFRRLQAYHQVGLPGQRLLDIGTGTGTLARGFATRGCQVTALDPSAPLLRAARDLAQEAGSRLALVQGVAEALPLASDSFDGITAGQCWHWFDRARAAEEAFRVLKPEGHLVIAHFDWLSLPGNVVEATETLIIRYNPPWADLPVLKWSGGVSIYRDWILDVTLAGFQKIETFSFDVDVLYTHEAWRGRIRASAGVAAGGLSAETIAAFDRDLARILEQRFPHEPLHVPHRVFTLVCQKPAAMA